MDIVVTIPKSEYQNDKKEDINVLKNGHNAFWTLSRVPKKLNIGDRVWSGRCQLTLDDLRSEKVQCMKGFQRFRYIG